MSHVTPVPESVLYKMRLWREEQDRQREEAFNKRQDRAFNAITSFADELPEKSHVRRIRTQPSKGNCPCNRYGTATYLCPQCDTVYCPQCENYRHTKCQKGVS